MKLALIGYGKMGKEVEKAALASNHFIGTIIDNEEDWHKNRDQFLKCDVAIEFSIPSMVISNLYKCFEAGIPVVTGTTGWNDRLAEVSETCSDKNGTLFYSSNFSIGVNIFFEINRRLASIMNRYGEYDIKLTETHHVQKMDAPSGTAITLANDIIAGIERKKTWTNLGAGNDSQLEILSIREGSVPGIHAIDWISDIDKISIRHEAFNRQGFARGAVMAAEFVIGKKGIFGMNDLLNL
jgi:4-hydroxy-tetrahydrodipicolinate reductase